MAGGHQDLRDVIKGISLLGPPLCGDSLLEMCTLFSIPGWANPPGHLVTTISQGNNASSGHKDHVGQDSSSEGRTGAAELRWAIFAAHLIGG